MSVVKFNVRQWRETIGLSQAKLSEITGIPQHRLSAHELGKDNLDDLLLERVRQLGHNLSMVEQVTYRRKRYREHRYASVQHDHTRLKKYVTSSGNASYLKALSALSAPPQKTSLTALSLFSGCGGLSLGFNAAGFNIKGYLELDSDLRSIYRTNFRKAFEMGGDIQDINDEFIEALALKLGVIDVIIGGPPCQGFSLSGKRKMDDPRNMLFKDYLRFVSVFRPKMAVLENVRLLTSMRNVENGFVKEDIKDAFAAHGYEIASFEINAKDYGVPQHRERVLFIAVDRRYHTAPTIPEPNFGRDTSLIPGKFTYRSFADACSDLAYLESGESDPTDSMHSAVTHPQHVIDWLWDVPEGRSAHDNVDRDKRPPSGYNTTYKRQIWAEPASTVQTTFGMISGCRNVHPIATRSLTIREAARIQSFPDQYIFSGSLGVIRTGIGNAVPPLLAFEIAKHFRSIISDFVEVPHSPAD